MKCAVRGRNHNRFPVIGGIFRDEPFPAPTALIQPVQDVEILSSDSLPYEQDPVSFDEASGCGARSCPCVPVVQRSVFDHFPGTQHPAVDIPVAADLSRPSYPDRATFVHRHGRLVIITRRLTDYDWLAPLATLSRSGVDLAVALGLGKRNPYEPDSPRSGRDCWMVVLPGFQALMGVILCSAASSAGFGLGLGPSLGRCASAATSNRSQAAASIFIDAEA